MWLLEKTTLHKLELATRNGFVPTAEQCSSFSSSLESSIQSNTSVINVRGVLTSEPDFLSLMFGGGNTTYSDITNALTLAESNDDVSSVVLDIDSPGGNVRGLFDALDAIENFSKPITARVSGRATSAAYAIASATNSIEATNAAAEFGSIGVAASIYVDQNVIDVTSTDAPNKRPDVTTDDGYAVVQNELNAIHELFVDTIARGRSTTSNNVNQNFGRGGVFLAGEALKRGMIDNIAGPNLQDVKSAKIKTAVVGDKSKRVKLMNIDELKAQHPDVYAAAVEIGVNNERDRVSSFVVAGEMSGDMKTALTAIKDGSPMTQTLQTQFLMASANRGDLNARNEDDASASAIDNVDNESTHQSEASNVIDEAIRLIGGAQNA